jgi:hypothetical protein
LENCHPLPTIDNVSRYLGFWNLDMNYNSFFLFNPYFSIPPLMAKITCLFVGPYIGNVGYKMLFQTIPSGTAMSSQISIAEECHHHHICGLDNRCYIA